MTTLQRLVSYPHAAAFDKAPAAVLLFRLTHPSGAKWVTAEAVMTATAGDVVTVYDLAALTVLQLTQALTSDGYTVTSAATEFSRYSALIIIEGTGDEGLSNGDHVTGYTSLMWALMGGYAGEVREAGLQVVQALRQMVITQAEGEWLDLWGKLYNEARRQGESDSAYAPRIPREAFRLRESPIAIEEAVFDATGKRIKIEEPWGSIFRLDTSLLSGPDHLQDGTSVGYFLLQPTSAVPIDWTDVLPVIHRNRAAGIVVLAPLSRNVSHVDAGIDGTVEIAITSIRSGDYKYIDRTLLDYSMIEDVSVLNHAAWHRTSVRHQSESMVSTGWVDGEWVDLPWTDSPYFVHSHYYRTYRVFVSQVLYQPLAWQDAQWPDATWGALIVEIGTRHTRS